MHGYSCDSGLKPQSTSRLRKVIKKCLVSPAFKPLRSHYRGLATILMYHRIVRREYCDSAFDPNLGLSVHERNFEDQLKHISANYNCLSLPEAVSGLRAGKLPSETVVVTFDDGYRDNLELALPLLEKYKVPAAIFVTTGLVERQAGVWWYEQEAILRSLKRLVFSWDGKQHDWRLETTSEKHAAWHGLNRLFKGLTLSKQRDLMDLLRAQSKETFSYDEMALTWEELRGLSTHPLVTIGAHTLNHPNLRLCSESEAEKELFESRLILEHRLGRPVPHAAYPFGSANEAGFREFRTAERAGFVSACTTRLGHVHSEHARYLTALPRICIDYHDDSVRFLWKLSGCYAMVHQRGRRVVTG